MLDSSLADKIVKHNEALDQLDNQGVAQEAMGVNAFVQGTASKPMSMCGPDLWAVCFPDKFPHGDGACGISRAVPLTFQQCVGMHLLREELSYQVTEPMFAAAEAWFATEEPKARAASSSEAATSRRSPPHAPVVTGAEDSSGPRQEATCLPVGASSSAALPRKCRPSVSATRHSACTCKQCVHACQPYTPPAQPRWGADRDLLCCYYDANGPFNKFAKQEGTC